MVPYFLDLHENVRFSKTLNKYQEQPYRTEKTTIVFLDPPKKACNIRGTFIEQPGNIPIFTIFSEYNIFGISQRNVPSIFHKHIFPR